jgi:hypothetical protein
MAEWKKFALATPEQLEPFQEKITRFNGTVNAGLEIVQGAVELAEKTVLFTAKPAAIAAQLFIDSTRQFVEDSFSVGGKKLVVHPWIHKVGKGKGINRHLSFPNAVTAIVNKMGDQWDKKRPAFNMIEVEAILIIVGAPSPSIFLETIKAFNVLFSLKEFRIAQRRIEQAMKLEKEKLIRKKPAKMPYWSGFELRDIKAMGSVEKSLLSQIKMAEGYAKGVTASLTHTLKLIQKKKAQVEKGTNEWNSAMALFSGGLDGTGTHILYVTGNGIKEVQAKIKKAKFSPGAELSFTAGLCLVAPKGALTIPVDAMKLEETYEA